jgi:hypothetical protein
MSMSARWGKIVEACRSGLLQAHGRHPVNLAEVRMACESESE